MCYLLSRLLNVLATITASAATSPLTYRSGVRPDYATFHILRVLSSDADTTVLPSGANLHAVTLSLWPSSVFKHSPALGFQSFSVLSRLALAISPSIDHATPKTISLPFS